MLIAELTDDGNAYTALFKFTWGDAAPCHYCQQPGQRVLVVVEDLLDGYKEGISRDSTPWRRVENQVRQGLFHNNRALCGDQGQCGELFHADRISWSWNCIKVTLGKSVVASANVQRLGLP